MTTQNPVGISADEFRRRLPDGIAYMRQLVERGVVTHSWVRVGGSGGLIICEVGSHEELLNLLYANPISPHLTFQVHPLVDAANFTGTF
jgi:muconolactone D-isomerase